MFSVLRTCTRKQLFVFAVALLSFVSTFSYSFAQATSLSGTVTITASIPSTEQNTSPPPSPPGGQIGGAAGGVMLTSANVDSAIFKGLAYPGSIVSLLKNGSILKEVPANPNGTFEIRIQNLPSGTYTFGIRAEDSQHLRSSLQIFTVYITQGLSVTVDGIFMAPTISTDKVEVARGSPITVFGSSPPNAKITVVINPSSDVMNKIVANANGFWSYTLSTQSLAIGPYEGKARSITANDLSLFSDPVAFLVGKTNKARQTSLRGNRQCDINIDGRVNLVDFSILAYWYKRTGFPEKLDLNKDQRIDLSDVSILAYCWTG